MTDVEINCKCAEFLGMTKMPGITHGGYWDESERRTRLVPESELFLERKKLGLRNEATGFVFDIFKGREDLERVERKLAIPRESIQERVTRVMDLLCKTNA